ncbi:MAG TPA: trypsin-like peptidase domain-containing protein [Steroidobacteraceae bacterium]|jgi:S1-C subfamily serine protease|nr:trypsin-like peptidase domain-containing protein [Steroidobacteraceae bacterium]
MKTGNAAIGCAAALLLLALSAAAQQPPDPGLLPPGPQGSAAVPELAVPALPARREDATWAATLERIAQSVVAIEIDSTRAFDTEWNTSAQATGFVIDAEQGLILTNRHVVTPGPVTAEATFLNREEVQLFPVYRDPVHDFGLYRYDPSKLRFIKPRSLPLYPEGAQIGREIRVIGNNAGEQLSILAGTLARLDREAPAYGLGKYNDFNTFYLQAASGTSGGSSGSPVIDIEGRVVALNAGGASGAASSFYLPLGRVRRAVDLIRAGKPVSRGTLQTVFSYTPYDELRRLGLSAVTEAALRKAAPANTGMLVVDEVLPGSAAFGQLQTGDVLVKINDKFVTQFEPLEELLDSSIGQTLNMEMQRGGTTISAQMLVGDLDAITPASFVEFGEAVVHTLSYQQARHFNLPVKGAYVANPGYALGAAGVPRGALITAMNGHSIEGLPDFRAAIEALGDGDRATLRYTTIDDPNGSQLKSMRMDRRWFPARACQRDDKAGIWPCQDLPPGPESKPAAVGATSFPKTTDPLVAKLAPSLVFLTFDMPYPISGITERNYHGTGLIVDIDRGLIVTDRNTVPVALGDVRITFAGAMEVPGKVVFIHPLHNLAVISYDPKLIGSTPVKAAKLDTRGLKLGAAVTAIGIDGDGDLKSRTTSIASIDPLVLPLSRTMQFRDSNLEVAQLLNPPTDFDGVLANNAGDVLGLWSSFAYESGREITQSNRGVPIDLVAEMLDDVRQGKLMHTLDAELGLQPLSSARRLGLSDAWVQRLEAANPEGHQVLGITRLTGGSPASKLLQQGDLLLSVAGKPVTRFREVERAVGDLAIVPVTVWRGDNEVTVSVPTTTLPGTDIDRIVMWAGATLQAPHRAMSAQRGITPEGVYVAYFAYGSPSTRYRLYPGRRIIEVDGQPTPNLDAFLKVVTGRPDRSSLRLRTITWNNSPEVITLKLDRHYWPTYEIVRGPDGWNRHSLD